MTEFLSKADYVSHLTPAFVEWAETSMGLDQRDLLDDTVLARILFREWRAAERARLEALECRS